MYEGFNQEPLTINDRFYYLTAESEKEHRDRQYYPVRMIKSFDLNNLPFEDEFINSFKQEQDA